jgi:hypothetical protein
MSLEEQVERIFKDLQKIGTLEREEKIMRIFSFVPEKIMFNGLKNLPSDTLRTLKTNMCEYSTLYLSVALKPCETYMKGIVEKGFLETIDLYTDNSRQVASLSLEDFSPCPCT